MLKKPMRSNWNLSYTAAPLTVCSTSASEITAKESYQKWNYKETKGCRCHAASETNLIYTVASDY